MTMKKKILTTLSVVLILGMAALGILAYLTSEDSDVNVMTLGNVQIEQHEYERVQNEDGTYSVDETTYGYPSYLLKAFTQAKPLYPATEVDANGNPENYGAGDWVYGTDVMFAQVGANGGGMSVFESSNAVDKFVFVENTGKSDAYVRTLIAFETGSVSLEKWEDLVGMSKHFSWDDMETIGVFTIEGNNYAVVEVVYKGRPDKGYHANGVLPAGEVTQCSLAQVYMKSTATNEDCEALDGNGNGTYDILVLSQAVQVEGFDDAVTALETAFPKGENNVNVAGWFGTVEKPVVTEDIDDLEGALKEGKDVILTDDVTAPLENSAIYGTPVAVIQKGGTFDGGGNTLDIENPQYNGYAIETYGGTIKNLTIDATVGRGIVISSPKEDVYIDNIVIDGPGYAINTTEHNGKKLTVADSTIKGWTSLAGLDSVLFTDCIFGENTSKYWQEMGYDQDYDRLVKPYVNTTFTGCEFEKGFYIDLSALGADCMITLDNCTCEEVKLTADNYNVYITIELPSGRDLADCVVFK